MVNIMKKLIKYVIMLLGIVIFGIILIPYLIEKFLMLIGKEDLK